MSELFSGPSPEEIRGTPVEVEAGREAAVLSAEALAAFEHFARGLPVEGRTGEIYRGMMSSLLARSDGIQVFADNPHASVARFIPEDLFHPDTSEDEIDISPDRFLIEVRMAGVNIFVEEMLELGRTLKLPIDLQTAKQLAYIHAIGHEAAHGIEDAYSFALSEVESIRPDSTVPTNGRLAHDALKAGLADEVHVPAAPSLSLDIEGERLAEGIGQQFVASEMRRMGLIKKDDLEEWVIQILTTQRMDDSYVRAEQLVAESKPGMGIGIVKLQMMIDDTSVHLIGYGRAHTKDEIARVLSITNPAPLPSDKQVAVEQENLEKERGDPWL
jgi:hypothetical protein